MAENIQVHVRVRPLNELERSRGDHECVHISDDGRTINHVVPPERAATGAPAVRALSFDSAIGGSSQARVFETTQITQLLQDALEGIAVTVFAYGQTGSGKTFTMTGSESVADGDGQFLPNGDGPHGLIPRGVTALFSLIAQQQQSGQLPGGCQVRASYLELYNESINDLLNPDETNLPLRSHARTGVFVENLLQIDCEGVEDAMSVFSEGTRNRKVGSHNLNKDSSRSHCMMTLYLSRRNAPGAEGRLSFVDLAGSERLPESQSAGAAAKETGHINKSLFALGNVISALADSRRRGGHIPYRDSKLTRLLMDSLGGDGRTLMLACCSPSSHHLDETLNTLTFASRTKNIQNRPVVPQADGSSLLLQMQQQMRALQEENAELRGRLSQPSPAPSSAHHVQPAAVAARAMAGGFGGNSGGGSGGGGRSGSSSVNASMEDGAALWRPAAFDTAGDADGAASSATSAGAGSGPPLGSRPGLALLRAASDSAGEPGSLQRESGAPPASKPGLAALRAASSATPEVAALKQEVAQLRTSNELLRKSHEAVVKENQQLQAKLERLELVFASSDR